MLLLFAVVVTAIRLGLNLYSHREPVYQGRLLSLWVEQCKANHYRANDARAADLDQEAEAAIRAVGAPGILYLLDAMRSRDSMLKKRVRGIFPQPWHARLHVDDRSATLRRVGANGLVALGTNAAAAVPALVQIGTDHPEPEGRQMALFVLRRLGPVAEPAIPFLIQCLTNNDAVIRDDAALGLGNIHRQPEIAVPALTRYLEAEKGGSSMKLGPGGPAPARLGWAVHDAIYAIAQFGSNARPAVPTLLTLSNHREPSVRDSATNALRLIDPEALPRQ